MRRPLLVLSVFLFALGLLLAGAPPAQADHDLDPPRDFRVTARTQTNITVTWDPPADTAGVNYYHLQWKLPADTSWQDVAVLHVSHNRIRNLGFSSHQPGTIFNFRVRSCNDSVAQHCSSAAEVTGATLIPPPANLRVTDTSNPDQDVLAWDAPTGTGGSAISDYEYRRRTSSFGSSWEAAVSLGSTATTVTVNKPSSGTGYVYQVRAVNMEGTSFWSDELIVGGRPTGLGAMTATASNILTRVELEWSEPSSTGGQPLTSYLVQWRADTTGAWTGGQVLGSKSVAGNQDGVAINDSDGLQTGTTYNFRYRACNKDRCSLFTPGDNSVAATTVSTVLVAVYDATVTEGDVMTVSVNLSRASSDSITVNWATSDGATARAGSDYVAASGSVTIPPGQMSETFTVNTLEDSIDESNESFTITLSEPPGGLPAGVQLGPQAPDTAHITDDDAAAGAARNLSATASGASITLGWNLPTNTGQLNGAAGVITGYQYRTATSSSGLNDAPWVDTNSAIRIHNVTVNAAGTHYFQVRALNGVSPEGLPSNTASAQVTIAANISDTDPDPLTERTLDGARLTLAFSGNVGSDLGISVVVGSAANAAGATLNTDTVTVAQAPRPDQVQNVRLTPGPGSLDVSWQAASNADGYLVQYRSGGGSWSEQHVSGGSTTRATLGDLLGETQYDVRVAATSRYAENGQWSTEASETTLPAHAIISATNPSPLTENNLGGARLTVDLLTERHPYTAASRSAGRPASSPAGSRWSRTFPGCPSPRCRACRIPGLRSRWLTT